MKPKKVPGVPSQVKGNFHDTESMKKFENTNETEVRFNALKERFFEISNWHSYSHKQQTKFTLCDSSGKTVQRPPQIGDYIQILLKKERNLKKEDFQWMQIDMIDKSNPDYILIQSRPSKLPGNRFAGKTAHFNAVTSTTTFIISKGDKYIKMAVYGRNIKPNKNTDFIRCLNNIFIAVGERAGLQKIKWKKLSDGLVNIQ